MRPHTKLALHCVPCHATELVHDLCSPCMLCSRCGDSRAAPGDGRALAPTPACLPATSRSAAQAGCCQSRTTSPVISRVTQAARRHLRVLTLHGSVLRGCCHRNLCVLALDMIQLLWRPNSAQPRYFPDRPDRRRRLTASPVVAISYSTCLSLALSAASWEAFAAAAAASFLSVMHSRSISCGRGHHLAQTWSQPVQCLATRGKKQQGQMPVMCHTWPACSPLIAAASACGTRVRAREGRMQSRAGRGGWGRHEHMSRSIAGHASKSPRSAMTPRANLRVDRSKFILKQLDALLQRDGICHPTPSAHGEYPNSRLRTPCSRRAMHPLAITAINSLCHIQHCRKLGACSVSFRCR